MSYTEALAHTAAMWARSSIPSRVERRREAWLTEYRGLKALFSREEDSLGHSQGKQEWLARDGLLKDPGRSQP